MTKLTALEKDMMLNGIAKSDFFDGWYENTSLWSWSLDNAKMKSTQRSGVVSSLSKKGIITKHEERSGEFITITRLGAKIGGQLK